MTNPPLEPCPWCGGNDLDVMLDRCTGLYSICCMREKPRCLACGPSERTAHAAREAWNRRVGAKGVDRENQS